MSGPQYCDLEVEDIVRNRIPVAQQYIDRLASSSTAMASTAASRTAASSSHAATVSSSATESSGGTISATQVQQATIAALRQLGLTSEEASSLLREHFTYQQASFGATGMACTTKNMQSVIVTAARMAVASRGYTNEQAAALIRRHLSQLPEAQASLTSNEGDEEEDEDSRRRVTGTTEQEISRRLCALHILTQYQEAIAANYSGSWRK